MSYKTLKGTMIQNPDMEASGDSSRQFVDMDKPVTCYISASDQNAMRAIQYELKHMACNEIPIPYFEDVDEADIANLLGCQSANVLIEIGKQGSQSIGTN